MTGVNSGFFKYHDPRIDRLAGYKLPSDWWSRPYEYAWAIGRVPELIEMDTTSFSDTTRVYTRVSPVVADMGCGWMYRPFKDALASLCAKVYAVDADARLLEQQHPDNVEFVVADFSQPIAAIPAASLDRIFCISVLEDIENPAAALVEFARLLKPSGKIVLTFDTPYNETKPCPRYPGLPMRRFFDAARTAGLRFSGKASMGRENAVYHGPWNLCVFHALLELDDA